MMVGIHFLEMDQIRMDELQECISQSWLIQSYSQGVQRYPRLENGGILGHLLDGLVARVCQRNILILYCRATASGRFPSSGTPVCENDGYIARDG
jgi:hypothetical protein